MDDVDKILNAKYKYIGTRQGIDGGIIFLYEDEDGNIIWEDNEV